MVDDKKTIGITKKNHSALQRLVENGQFGSELDAAMFAMAYAIQNGEIAGRAEGADTKWNVGSVDSTGDLRFLVNTLYPDVNEPYRLLEYLMNKGLADLAGCKDEALDVYGILFEGESSAAKRDHS